MSMGWGLAREARLIEHDDAEEYDDPAVADLNPGEVAVVSDLGAIYGSPAELVGLARRILGRWGEQCGPSHDRGSHLCDDECGDDTHPRDGRTVPTDTDPATGG